MNEPRQGIDNTSTPDWSKIPHAPSPELIEASGRLTQLAHENADRGAIPVELVNILIGVMRYFEHPHAAQSGRRAEIERIRLDAAGLEHKLRDR